MPFEKSLRPFCSLTVQQGPSFLMRLLSAASPGGRRAQSEGICRRSPFSVVTNPFFLLVRTSRDWLLMLICFFTSLGLARMLWFRSA